jgi:hypothetical protein
VCVNDARCNARQLANSHRRVLSLRGPRESLFNAEVKMPQKSTYGKGTEYEDFVANIYDSILSAEQLGKIKRIALERRKPLICKSGTTTKVDIYWEYEVAETTVRTAIECKDYKSAVPVKELRDFAHKLGDIAGTPINGLFVTKNGFQSGARQVAKEAGIKLMNLREVEERDWEGYLQEVNIKLPILSSPRIRNIELIWNEAWKNEREGAILTIAGKSDEIFIEDLDDGFKKSLHELAKNELYNSSPGQHIWEKKLSNGLFKMPAAEYKIDAIRITYDVSIPHTIEMRIDFTKHVSAILEYVEETSKKFTITREGKKQAY